MISYIKIWRAWDRVSWYISLVKTIRCTVFRVYWISLYMFRMVSPSIIRSSRLYMQHQVYVIQVSWLHARGHEMEHLVPASTQSAKLYDIYLMLYVQSWTPDDGRTDRPKHVEWYSINSKNCASSWFHYRLTLKVTESNIQPVLAVKCNPFPTNFKLSSSVISSSDIRK